MFEDLERANGKQDELFVDDVQAGRKRGQPGQKRQPEKVHPCEIAPLIHAVLLDTGYGARDTEYGIRVRVTWSSSPSSLHEFSIVTTEPRVPCPVSRVPFLHFSPTISRSVWAA